MVARSPSTKEKTAAATAAAVLNPALVRETLRKMDRCMARLQELQYTVAGGSKVVSGVSLSPRSTRGYLRTSIRCKQESLRMRGASAQKKSPNGKFGRFMPGAHEGDWRRMSLPAMLLGETVLEILQASQFARDINALAGDGARSREPPRTPNPISRARRATAEQTPHRVRRAREKQRQQGTARSEAASPPMRARARSRIQFKSTSPVGRTSISVFRVSPKNRPWAKKTVLFANPTFASSSSHASPSPSKKQRFYKTRSPIITRNTTASQQVAPDKFLIKSPPTALDAKLKSRAKAIPATTVLGSPQEKSSAPTNARRCSFSPSRLATRLMSPIKARMSLHRSRDGVLMSGLKQRPGFTMTPRMAPRTTPSSSSAETSLKEDKKSNKIFFPSS